MTVIGFLLLCLIVTVLIDGHLTRRKLTQMALDLNAATDAVAANTAATTAVVNALTAARSEPDQAALDALTSQITTNTDALNAAANPPA